MIIGGVQEEAAAFNLCQNFRGIKREGGGDTSGQIQWNTFGSEKCYSE